MAERYQALEAEGIRLVIDLEGGHLRSLVIERQGGRAVEPLHRAPWADEPDDRLPPATAKVERVLSGDFLCAPFAASDVEAGPPHGWTANGSWRHLATEALPGGGTVGRFELVERVMGARVVKELRLIDGHPFVYQRHVFEGGEGALPVSHHAMTRVAGTGRLAFSPKAFGETPAEPLEPDPTRGRSLLAYPARFTSLAAVPLAAGGVADLRTYPFAEGHEDFLMLVEAPEARLGWAAVAREAEDDLFLTLKDARAMPVTMLWMSNGGRAYAPWSGRHRGVLGVEDGRTWSLNGHRASIGPNPLHAAGRPTALALVPGGAIELRYALGGLPLPAGWREIAAIVPAESELRLTEAGGGTLSLPFAAGWLLGGGG